jgi:hypothetical protein
MFRRVVLFVGVLAVLAGGRTDARLSAQVTAVDSAAVLLDAADRFDAEGQRDVAQAVLRYVLRRFPGTPAAMIAGQRLNAVRERGTAGSGRVELQVWSTLYGLWLGVAVPGAFGADDSEPYGLGLLAGGPLGFLAGSHVLGRGEITEGQARAITLGGSWGTWQGFGWAEVLDLGQQTVCYDDGYGEYCYEDDRSSEETFASMIVGGLAGIAAGTALSRRTISPGTATAANFGALWGSWLGFGTGYVADLEDDALLGATLLAGDAGLLGMAAMAPRWNVSRSRARLVSIYGVVGGLSGLGVDLLAQPDDEKVAVGIPLAGSIVGLAVGIAATRDYDGVEVASASVPGGALLNLEGGDWNIGAPLPFPRRVELDLPGRTLRRTALGLTLLQAKF